MSYSPMSTRWTAAVAACSIAALISPMARAASQEIASVGLTLQPPWFETWPARVLALVTLTAVMAGLVKLRERRLRQRHGELEALVEVRTAELAEAKATLKLLAASTDELTGIANRRAFDQTLAAELRRASRGQGEIALLLVEIDHFKAYNEIYGRAAGDECLRRVARTLAAGVTRAGDVVARFGGDDFVVLLPTSDRRGAAMLAERARRAVEALAMPNTGSGCSPSVTVSVGAASLVALRGGGGEVLIGNAEEALRRAKTEGRNRSSTYQLDDQPRALRLVAG